MNPESRPHLLRDDLEGIVLILVYYALRYIPLEGPEERVRKAKDKLLGDLRAVFGADVVTVTEDNVVAGGQLKAQFLAGNSYTLRIRELEGLMQPMPLFTLVSSSCDLFKDVYVLEPDKPLTRTNRLATEAYEVAYAIWKGKHERAIENLESPESLRSIFREVLTSPDFAGHWPASAAKPFDQYPSPTRPPSGPDAWQGNYANAATGTKRRRLDYGSGTGALERPKKRARTLAEDEDVFGSSSRHAVDDQGDSDDQGGSDDQGDSDEDSVHDEDVVHDDDGVEGEAEGRSEAHRAESAELWLGISLRQ
jgi:hypothetical protein